MCRQEYSLPLQAQDSQEAFGRRLAKHMRRMWSKPPDSFTAMAGDRGAGFAKTACRGGCIASIMKLFAQRYDLCIRETHTHTNGQRLWEV